ncbi:MAG TPA: crossover junction endodeoxyribonuclease RuvC [Aggregatilineales bacterium]|nr:crossover junction endodeoxyribonuclease RuvC [Aggregatilineales bacterium]
MTDAYFSVVGIDPSLTATGVVAIQSAEGATGTRVHTFGRRGKTSEPLMTRLARLNDTVTAVQNVIRELVVYPDVITIESPAHNQTTGSHHDRSGLWWLLVRELTYEMGLKVVEIGPTQVKTYATGKGNAGKTEVMAAVIRRHLDVPITNDNEADAFVLAAMGARLIGQPIEDSLPQTHLRAMDKVAPHD